MYISSLYTKLPVGATRPLKQLLKRICCEHNIVTESWPEVSRLHILDIRLRVLWPLVRALNIFKADFQSELRSLSALMFVRLASLTKIRGKSMLFVTNCLPYLWGEFKFFFQQFPWVLQLWRFFIKWYQKEWSIKLPIEKWQLTWNSAFPSCK